MTPADELKAAATKLRALATAASTDDDGTHTAHWRAEPCWPDGPDDGNRFLYGDRPLLHGGGPHRPARMRARHAEYIATMDPSVGLALADWLDWQARALTEGHIATPDAALAVARQILGTPETER
ncbi:hypothetical protein [Streptomyces acidiscabies]|uniref:hypothetical protein n=1 Tax=Streptomyces acidiscabies TaxID=42234 RepID=UPI00073E66C1|nr:hypothetical protein [Streptomyces acidiscabies]GAQ52098.1 hypothetical protein a10_01879 [Streptomyces acidiscabies]